MKKAISIILCLVLVCSVLALAGCKKQDGIKSDIVLITDSGTVRDGGHNQSAWDGITQFASDNAMTCRYYQPPLEDGELTLDTIEKYISLAASNGAKYIILPGEAFAVAAYEFAPSYPDVKFVLIDATPHADGDTIDHYVPNVLGVNFDTLQSGFLAGYIAVASGNTKLGYFGEFSSEKSASYGAGFVQGAAYAADNMGIPVTLDWADYDSPLLDYSYSVNITAVYDKIENAKEETHKVVIENGKGSGVYTQGSNITITADPAPEGQEFDHWEKKSNTDGIKDSKVNISTTSKESTNLLIEKCDCTLTAVYKDIEGTTYPVKVTSPVNSYSAVYSVAENSSCEVTAPASPINTVFDHWESSVADAVEDASSPTTTVNVTNTEVDLTPVYRESDTPTFNLSVMTGEGGEGDSEGSGSYLAGDWVTVTAAEPKEGYMFSHWTNADKDGNSTGIAMENEYFWRTGFEMVDRYAAIPGAMFNKGVTAVFAGGNSQFESVYTAKGNFDKTINVIASDVEHSDSYSAVIKNYGEAVKDAMELLENNGTGGQTITANCSNDGIFATYVSDDKEIQQGYDEVYKLLADGKLKLVNVQGGAGYEFCKIFPDKFDSKCLSLNGWFLDPIVDND